MLFRWIILYCCLSYSSALLQYPKEERCMLGPMSNTPTWIDEKGGLHIDGADIGNAIDVSTHSNPVPALHQEMISFRSSKTYIKYLSMAKCGLNRVPPIFHFRDSQSRQLASTLEYLTFFGNAFLGITSFGDHYTMSFNATSTSEMNLSDSQTQVANLWSSGFKSVNFPRLKELDLRSCYIQILGNHLFVGMPNLEALYLGGNEIFYIESTAFRGLSNLKHLDFSRNNAVDESDNPRVLSTENDFVFSYLENLVTLNMSFTKLTPRNLVLFRNLGKSLKGLSICETGLSSIHESVFNTTSLEVLDVSRNNGILDADVFLKGLEDSLMILYARDVGLQTMGIFQNFSRLEILQLAFNEINEVDELIAISLRNLKFLDLDKNRITSWFKPTYALIPNLRFLSLKDNNINVITEEIIEDIMHVQFLGMSGNFMVCNCHAKDFIKMAAMNEYLFEHTTIEMPENQLYRSGWYLFISIINDREIVRLECDQKCLGDMAGPTGRFRLIDNHVDSYSCLLVPESRSVQMADVTSCIKAARDINYELELSKGMKKLLALLVIPCVLLPVALLFIFRRNLKYFFITVRNSAMLSLINKSDTVDDTTIFNYDVFVSYCNEDRAWVLDHLLPHIEAECSISACLHERDFQVGLSILENIVSCMDRSRSIMLILSQRFLLSQWCQFEMHLAQHRLLETRREDLTLVLLEDIPRRLRPNTLHYLMLTKTYIVWPKDESERHIFWKRLKKTLISQKPVENVSLV